MPVFTVAATATGSPGHEHDPPEALAVIAHCARSAACAVAHAMGTVADPVLPAVVLTVGAPCGAVYVITHPLGAVCAGVCDADTGAPRCAGVVLSDTDLGLALGA